MKDKLLVDSVKRGTAFIFTILGLLLLCILIAALLGTMAMYEGAGLKVEQPQYTFSFHDHRL